MNINRFVVCLLVCAEAKQIFESVFVVLYDALYWLCITCIMFDCMYWWVWPPLIWIVNYSGL